jgi:hypothetical protein
MSSAGTRQRATKFRKNAGWGRLVPPLASGLLGSLDKGPLHGDGLSEDLALVQLLLHQRQSVVHGHHMVLGSVPGLFFLGFEFVRTRFGTS